MMAGHERLFQTSAEPGAVRSCWLCGKYLPVSQMVADGGSACADLRWYCRDRRGCTERWTGAATLARGRDGSGETSRSTAAGRTAGAGLAPAGQELGDP